MKNDYCDDDTIREKIHIEVEYKEPQIPKQRCSNCPHSYVTNAGAVIPGLCCRVMKSKYIKLGFRDGNDIVCKSGTCKFWNQLILGEEFKYD